MNTAPAHPTASRMLALAVVLAQATVSAQNSMPTPVVSGWDSSAFVTADGTAWTSGNNTCGQLGVAGTGAFSTRLKPILLARNVHAAALGGNANNNPSLFVLKRDGTLWACGNNGYGQFGTGSTSSYADATLDKIDDGVKGVAARADFSLRLKLDGSVWSCGRNTSGQLGDGTTSDRSNPVKVMEGVQAIAAGYGHSLFLKTDGTAWACGSNVSGRLGDGTTTNRAAPVQVLSGVKAVAAGGSHSLFLKTDGSLWACGLNTTGPLGDGTTTNRSTPVKVLDGVKAMSAGGTHSLFLKTDGTAWACGTNTSGRLGDGTTTHRSTPVMVLGDVQALAAGESHSLFLKNDGVAWGCGSNSGRVPDASGLSQSSPVPTLLSNVATPSLPAPVELVSTTCKVALGRALTFPIPTVAPGPAFYRATGLPPGLALDPTLGLITGTPTTAGTFAVAVSAENLGGKTSATLTLEVRTEALAFPIGGGVVEATLGQVIEHPIGAANAPSAVEVLGLPPGLRTFDFDSDGIIDRIHGIPLVAGDHTVRIRGENALGRVELPLLLRIKPTPAATTAQLIEGVDLKAMTQDEAGNTWLVGNFHGSVSLGDKTHTAAEGAVDCLVVKLEPSGAIAWSAALASDGSIDPQNIAVDSYGSGVICGSLHGVNTLAGSASTGTFFVARFSRTGVLEWAKSDGAGGRNVACPALAIGTDRRIWVGGSFQGTLGFEGGTSLTSASTEDSNNGFVAEYSSSRSFLSSHLFASTRGAEIRSIVADSGGTRHPRCVAGSFTGNVTVPGTGAPLTLNNPDPEAQTGFLATLAQSAWAVQIPQGDFWQRNCLVSDATYGLYAAGYRMGGDPPSTDLPPNSVALGGTPQGAFVLKVSTRSWPPSIAWVRDLPGDAFQPPTLAFDGIDGLYLENRASSGRFDSTEFETATGRYLTQIDPTTGAVRWVRESPAPFSSDYPLLSVDRAGNPALALKSDGSAPIGIDGQSLTGPGWALFQLDSPVTGGARPTITSPGTAAWTAGREFTYSIAADGSPTSYWVSDLPTWASFDETTGVVTGTPDQEGTHEWTVWAMNAAGATSTTLRVTVAPDPRPQFTSPATATATVGQAFRYRITATHSPTSYDAYGLPEGFAIDRGTGEITGTPTLAARILLVIKAANAEGENGMMLQIEVAGDPAIPLPTIESGSVRATVGQAMSYPIRATGALAYEMSVFPRPEGLRFDAVNGILSGTLTAPGIHAITLRAINGGGIATALLELTVSAPGGGGTSLATWRQQHFGTGENKDTAADLATPDDDGIPNLLKYGLAIAPGRDGSEGLPRVSLGADGRARLQIRRDPLRPSVHLIVEAQAGLDGTWTEIARSAAGAAFTGTAEITESDAPGDLKQVSIRDTSGAAEGATRRFLRVRVVLAE